MSACSSSRFRARLWVSTRSWRKRKKRSIFPLAWALPGRWAEGCLRPGERAARAATDEVQRQTEGADSALVDGSSDEPEAGGTSDEQGNAYSGHGQGGPFGRDQVDPSSAKSLSRLLGQQAHLDEYTLLTKSGNPCRLQQRFGDGARQNPSFSSK